MIELLPDRIDKWIAQTPDRLCDRRTLYDYMDGAAEVYLVYAFAGLVVRKFRRSRGPSIVVELFDMTTSFDAFGVFTNGRDEDQPDAKIGQGAEHRPGLLTFWQDRYFVAVRVDAESVDRAADAAAAKLGRVIASAVATPGPLPEVLGYLPTDGLIAHSVRYVYRRDALNYHYDLGDRNPLHLGPHTQGVLATYRRDKARCYVLCVLYPTAALATKARRGFIDGFARGADRRGAAKIDADRWTAVATGGRLLAAALDSPTRAGALELAGEAIERFRIRRKKSSNKESRP